VTRAARIALAGAAAAVTIAAVARFPRTTDATADVQLLAINDFHGALEPASGGTGQIGGTETAVIRC